VPGGEFIAPNRDPKRFRGFLGAAQAAAASGNKDKARYH
jgi:hypothetical protein